MRVLYVKSIFRRLLLKFYTAIIGILFVLIFLSFPFGAYVIFNAEIGSTITYEFQLDSFYVFFAGLPVDLPINNQLGETFIIFWCFYLLFFTILMLGPRKNILQSLVGTVQGECITDDYSMACCIINNIKSVGYHTTVSWRRHRLR